MNVLHKEPKAIPGHRAWFCNKPCDTNWQGFEARSKQTRPIQNGFETLPNDQSVAPTMKVVDIARNNKAPVWRVCKQPPPYEKVISCYPLLSNERMPLWNLSSSFRL